jgi:hypothetical protein
MERFEKLLESFIEAACAPDPEAFGALFHHDGSYDDGFFGIHRGRKAISAMIGRFHEGGREFRWDFSHPLCAGDLAYASYQFSYRSKLDPVKDQIICFNGMARFHLRDNLIRDYAEVFDRGMAFAQMKMPASKISRLLERYAEDLRLKPDISAHLFKRQQG